MYKKLYAIMMSLFLTAAVLPQNVYAEDEPAEETAEETVETEEIEQEEEIPDEIIEEEGPAEETVPEEMIPEDTEESVPEEEIEEPEEETEEEITEPEEIEPEEVIPEEIVEEVVPSEETVIEEEEIPEEVVPSEETVIEEEEIPEDTEEPVIEEEAEEPEETVKEPEQTEPEKAVEEEIREEPEEIIEEEIQEEPELFEAEDGDYTVGSYTYTVSSGKAYISKYNGTASSVTLPTSVTISGSSYKLTALGAYAFENNQYLNSVTIPAAYKKIEKGAFRNCINLSSVTINGNIGDCSAGMNGIWNESASQSVFYNAGTNTGGMTVTFGSSVTRVPAYIFLTRYDVSEDVYAHVKTVNLSSSITSIGDSAFENCYDLSSVNFKDAAALQTIGDCAFRNTKLKSLSFANKLSAICKSAFENNYNLKSIILPKSLKTLGNTVFKNCTNLSSVTINGNIGDCGSGMNGIWDDSENQCVFYNTGTNTDGMTVTFGSSVTRVPAYMFITRYDASEDVYAHVKTVKLSSSITTIEESAFENCYDLSSVNFKDAAALQTIGDYAFRNTKLKSLSFANKLSTICRGAFADNKNLKSIVLPKSLKTLGEIAFKNCTNLSSVTINGNIGDCSSGINTNGYNASEKLSVFYNTGTNTNGMTVTFGSSVTRVPANIFLTRYDESEDVYAHVKKVVIPKSVKTIGAGAFCNCYDITSVEIKRNSVTIGENAFGNDTKIKATVYYNGPAYKAMKAYTKKFAYYTPLQPTISKLTATQEGIIVSWKAAVGASKYYVYRKTGTGSYKQIATVTKLQYFDKAAKTDGKKYTYKVKAAVQTKTSTASAGKAVTYKKSTALKKGWMKIGNDMYYVTASYTYTKGWKKISGKNYYFASSGKMVKGWKTISGSKYYFLSDGSMVTGWKKIGGKLYWFESDGVMFASSSSNYNASKYINGKYYYFDSNGVCQNP